MSLVPSDSAKTGNSETNLRALGLITSKLTTPFRRAPHACSPTRCAPIGVGGDALRRDGASLPTRPWHCARPESR